MKIKIKACFMLYLMVFLCPFVNGQNVVGDLYGKVIDKESQSTLPGANIKIFSNKETSGTISNDAGEFHFESISIGRITIEFSMIGYEKKVLPNVLISSGKAKFLTIELQEKVEFLGEVVVKAHARDEVTNEFAMVGARTFTVEESNKYAGSWGDPARMVANFAGVVTAGDQRNDIIIRGNSPTGVLWKLDGITIPNPNHFGTFGSTGGPICMLNNNQLRNSDFYTGAFPSEFGNATSGVFDLKMRNGNTHEHEFMGGTGFNGFEIGAEGPISKSAGSSYLINIRYTMMDLMAAMGMFNVGGIPKYADVSFKFFLPTKRLGTFSVFGVGGKSKIQINDDSGSVSESGNGWTSEVLPGTNVENGSKMGVVGVTNKYFFSGKSRLESSVSANFSNSFNNVDSLGQISTFNFYNDSYTETTYSFSTKYTLKKNSRNSFQTGGSVDRYVFNFFDEVYFSSTDEFVQGTNTEGNATLYQAFVQYKKRLTNGLSMNWGLHGQLFGLNNEAILEPRIGFSYKLNQKQRVSFGYGLHGQVQPRLVYFTQTLTDSVNNNYSLTNKELGFSKSHQLVAGFNWSIAKNMHLKFEAYYQYLYDIPVENKQSVFSMINYGACFHNDSNDSLVNNGLGQNSGIEFTLEKFLSNNFYCLLTASLYDSRYRANDLVWRNNAFNGNYAVNVLAGYELPIKNDLLSINIKSVWAGGRRYIPIDLDASKLKGETVYDEGCAYAEKYPGYFRTDLRISFRQNLKRISQVWSFDVQNLTNHENIFTQHFDSDSRKIVNVFQMGFFPIGSWKIYF